MGTPSSGIGGCGSSNTNRMLEAPSDTFRWSEVQHAEVSSDPDRHGHPHRLDLADATVREWDATVLSAEPEQGIVLDRSAFYPGGGGQPPDEGVLLWGGVRTRVAGTRKGDELYLIP